MKPKAGCNQLQIQTRISLQLHVLLFSSFSASHGWVAF